MSKQLKEHHKELQANRRNVGNYKGALLTGWPRIAFWTLLALLFYIIVDYIIYG